MKNVAKIKHIPSRYVSSTCNISMSSPLDTAFAKKRLSPSMLAEIIELLCEAMRFALAENAEGREGEKRRGLDYRKEGERRE